MKKIVLVTGGAGYIGSVLVKRLLEEDWTVRNVDICFFGKTHLPLNHKSYQLIEEDIRTVGASHFNDVGAVIHLAAISNDPMANFAPKLNFDVNVIGTRRIAELAKKSGVKRFIFASSSSIYHDEGKNTVLYREDQSVNPKEPYSKAKFLAERYLLSLADAKFQTIIFRMGTVGGYSPRMKFDLVVNSMIKTALNENQIIIHEGFQYRPLIDIRDVVEAYFLALNFRDLYFYGEIFNLAFGNYLIDTLAQQITDVCSRGGKRPKTIRTKTAHKNKSYRISTKKMVSYFGWKPLLSAKETAKNLFEIIHDDPSFHYSDTKYYNFLHTKCILKKLEKEINK